MVLQTVLKDASAYIFSPFVRSIPPWGPKNDLCVEPKRMSEYFIASGWNLEKNDMICDREGRLGLSEVTRLGFSDMDRIAGAVSEAIKGKDVRREVAEILRISGVRFCK